LVTTFLEYIPDVDAFGFDTFAVFSLCTLLLSKILQVLADVELSVKVGGS
jgi:hypothetical protein